MKNTLTDLKNHLFAQLERLGEEDLSEEDLEKEIRRSEAIDRVGKDVISIANLQLRAAKLSAEYGGEMHLTNLLEEK